MLLLLFIVVKICKTVKSCMIKEQCGVLIKSRHDIVMAFINLLESNLYKQKKQFL